MTAVRRAETVVVVARSTPLTSSTLFLRIRSRARYPCTTTVSALRTAVIAALALGNQRLVLDQINALNTTTGNIIESTSQMLRQQTLEIAGQAANTTISIEKLQAAFNNIYATIDTIDSFKLAALENMRKTIDSLSSEVARAQHYVERSRAAELAQARASGLVSELTLPASGQGA